MNIVAVVALCIIATLICKNYERNNHRDYSMILSITVTIVILIFVINYISPIFSTINDLLTEAGLQNEYIEILFKALGICYICQLASDNCRDASENAMANQVEFAGKISLLILALPLISNLTSVVRSLITM